METTQVIIVGAGPAGLTLGLCLAQHKIFSVILEKEKYITQDPRGVYLTGDSVRIFHTIGLAADMQEIGHAVELLSFHKSSFAHKPFHKLDQTTDAISQAVPNGILQIQPKLEQSLRRQVDLSNWCTLRTGCEVVSQLSGESPTIEYKTEAGDLRQLQGQWLVGADGKTGIVRKYFLEPTAGIKQEEGLYRYSGTWIAANLKITLPTPQSHPSLPWWDAGYSPEEVYDLFWPKGWHFCSPPGKPTATGQFGPYEERLWRHEFRQEDWNDSMNAEDLLWEHLTPMITRDCGPGGIKSTGPIPFPRDCIEVIRCRPFKFVHKVVNEWFHDRTILIGDAAHVFPPFAGQGIGSGVRDAHQLAWRLAMLLSTSNRSKSLRDTILKQWALERRKSVDDAALFSKLNGMLCNEEPSLWVRAILYLVSFLGSFALLRDVLDTTVRKEREGMTSVRGGFFLERFHGGGRMAQIWVQSPDRAPFLSDALFVPKEGVLTLLVVSTDDHEQLRRDAQMAIEAMKVDPSVLSTNSLVSFSSRPLSKVEERADVYWPTAALNLGETCRPGYDEHVLVSRLGRSTKFALVRADFHIYACARDLKDLASILGTLKSTF